MVSALVRGLRSLVLVSKGRLYPAAGGEKISQTALTCDERRWRSSRVPRRATHTGFMSAQKVHRLLDSVRRSVTKCGAARLYPFISPPSDVTDTQTHLLLAPTSFACVQSSLRSITIPDFLLSILKTLLLSSFSFFFKHRLHRLLQMSCCQT